MSYPPTGCRLAPQVLRFARSRVDSVADVDWTFVDAPLLAVPGGRFTGDFWRTAHFDPPRGHADVTRRRSHDPLPAKKPPEKPPSPVPSSPETGTDSSSAKPNGAVAKPGRPSVCNLQGRRFSADCDMGAVQTGTDAVLTPLIAAMVEALSVDPALSGAQFARRYSISLSQLVRLFKSQLGVSMVEYRNRIRLDRFWQSVIGGQSNLMQASKDAGFGSYAQFHRVFRKRYKDTPRTALRRPPNAFEGVEPGM